jgi:hypothetical protein
MILRFPLCDGGKFALAIAALLLSIPALAVNTADTIEPPIKLSQSGICHERGSSFYVVTEHYRSFDTLAECLKAGGRLPKTGRNKLAATKGQPIDPTLRENPGVPFIRSIPSRDIAMGAILVIAVGLLVAFVRFRARRYPRVYFKRVAEKQGDPLRSSGTDRPSADERRLLKACLGSKEVAERLIQFELERNPVLSRGRAAAAAVRRIARDSK